MPELRHLPYDWLHVGGAAWGSHDPRSTGGVNLPSDIPTQAKTGLEWATWLSSQIVLWKTFSSLGMMKTASSLAS